MKTIIHKIIKKIPILAGLALLLALSGCGDIDPKKPILKLGTSLDYPPFEFSKNGEAMGIDIDIARLIAEELGCTLKISDLDFNGLIPALNTKHVDFVMSALTPTEKRRENIDFSDIYFNATLASVHKIETTINAPKDLGGKHIGVQLGSIMENYAQEKAKEFPEIRILSIARNPQLIQELKVGRIDSVIVEESQAINFAKSNPGLTYTTLTEGGDGYAIAFKQGSELKNKINSILIKLKEDGELQSIKEKWLNHE